MIDKTSANKRDDKPIKVLIVDNYVTVRQGLAALIATAPDMLVAGEANDRATAIHKTRHLHPDIILIDLMKLRWHNIQTIALLKQENPHMYILVLTNFSQQQYILAALNAGACGYLLKDAVFTNILSAIREALTGKLIIHPSLTHIVTTTNDYVI